MIYAQLFRRLLIFELLSVFCFAGCESPTSEMPVRETLTPVAAMRVTRLESYSIARTFYGRVRSVRRSDVSFEIAGTVADVLVEEGQQVRAGELLIKIDHATLRAEREMLIAKRRTEGAQLNKLAAGQRKEVIDAARADVAKFEAQFTRASLSQGRLRNLARDGVATQEDYERSLYEARALKAASNSSKAKLNELVAGTRGEDVQIQQSRIAEIDAELGLVDAKLKQTSLHAPYHANVLKRHVNKGSTVQPGQIVMQLLEAGKYEAVLSLPLARFTPNTVMKDVAVREMTFPVSQQRALRTVDADTRTIQVVLSLEKPDGLVDGESCNVQVVQNVSHRCIALPITAVVPSVRGLWSCYVLQQDRERACYVCRRSDVTIHHTDGETVYVDASLQDNQLVVVDGLHKLAPGIGVQIVGESQ